MGVDFGVHTEVMPAISFIRSSKAQSNFEKALDGNSNLTSRASFFSLNPMTTLGLHGKGFESRVGVGSGDSFSEERGVIATRSRTEDDVRG